jgi:hypothetical protein
MSTNMAFKEPPNTLVFSTEYSVMTANYNSEKVAIDKKTKELRYTCSWVLSDFRVGEMRYLGTLQTPLEAQDDLEAEDRINEIADSVASIMVLAGTQEEDDPGLSILGEPTGREIIAAVHARFLSQFLHSTELEFSVLAVRAFLKKMNVKNTKKILSDVFDAKIVEDIKNKKLK